MVPEPNMFPKKTLLKKCYQSELGTNECYTKEIQKIFIKQVKRSCLLSKEKCSIFAMTFLATSFL